MVIIYQGDVGRRKYFQIYEADGKTKARMTGITARWRFKDRDGNTLSKEMDKEDDTGLVSFVITSDITLTAKRWTCQIELYAGSAFVDKTDPFTVEIEKKT